MKTIPDGIVGYRIFKLHHEDSLGYLGSRAFGERLELDIHSPPYLASLFMYSIWQPGINEAECKGKTDLALGGKNIQYCQSAPGQGCNCGLQAYFRLGQKVILTPSFFEEHIFAAVLGGGKVLLHPDGFRSEKAAIIGLLRNPYRLSDETLKSHQEVADKYNVPLLDNRDDLIDLASSKGVSVKSPTDLKGLQFSRQEEKDLKPNRLVNSGATNETYSLGYVSELVLLNNLAGDKLLIKNFYLDKRETETLDLIDKSTKVMDQELTGMKKIIFNLFFKQTLAAIIAAFLVWITAIVLFGLGAEAALGGLGVSVPFFAILLLTTLTFPIFVVVVFEKAENYLRKIALKPAINKFGT